MAGLRDLVVVWLTCVSFTLAVDWDVRTPLDEYVHRDDGYFSWVQLAEYRYEGVTVYIVNMTAQKYQDETFINKPVWWHFMGIAIPDNVAYSDAAGMFIDGGSSHITNQPPEENDIENIAIALFANDTGTVQAYIKSIPNQPVVFVNDPTQRSRSEDSIIAWTWRTYIDENPDPEIILRMPMTKSAKRGLDTIYEVAKSKVPTLNINRFIVSGASKRGWTTWSLAATDQRVKAIAPMVFSMLNMNPTLQRHFQNMDGAWSFAFDSYYRENLTQELFNPKTQGVWEVEDMYNYRERLTLPILEIVSSGDEFFLCDDNYNWWNGIPEPKYLMMLQNSEHSMAPHYIKMYETIESFWQIYLQNLPPPRISWTMHHHPGGGRIEFYTNKVPDEITAWSATTLANDTRRDFRLAEWPEDTVAFHPVIWREDIPVSNKGNGVYHVNADVVEDEWVGFFVQGTWTGPSGYRMIMTSQINIIPDTYPHPPCTDAASCYSKLV